MTARLLRWLALVELLFVLAWAIGLYRVAEWSLADALLAAALLPLIMHGWAVGIESIAGAWWRRRTGADGGGLRLAVRAWLSETWVSFRTFHLDVPWLAGIALAQPQTTNDPAMPVLLVHGHFCNRAVWRSLAPWLGERGHPVEAINMEPPFADIDHYAPQIEAAASDLLRRSGATRLAVIGHSLGTMAIRAWVRRYGHRRLAAFVSLGGPHQGIWTAKFGHTAGILQLRTGSPWIAELARTESEEFLRRATVILSLHDNIIMPQAVQTLPGARTVTLRGIGHLELLHHHAVRLPIGEALDAAAQG